MTGRTKFGRGVLKQAGNLSPVNYGWLLPSIEDESESFLEEYYITQGLTDWAALMFGRLMIGNLGDPNRLAGNEQTQFVNTALRNSPLLNVVTSSLSVHSALLLIQPSPHVAIAPFALSRNDKDGVYGSPGGLFSEYSVGAQVIVNWEIGGLTGEFLPIGGWTNKDKFDSPLLILDIIEGSTFPEKNGNWIVGFSANQYLYVPKDSKSTEAGPGDPVHPPAGGDRRLPALPLRGGPEPLQHLRERRHQGPRRDPDAAARPLRCRLLRALPLRRFQEPPHPR